MPTIDTLSFPELRAPTAVNGLGEMIMSALSSAQAMQKIKGDFYSNLIQKAKSQYAPEMSLAELKTEEAKPALMGAQASQYPSENALRQQQTREQMIKNIFLPQREPAEIAEINQRAKYYGMGGSAGSAGTRDELAFQNSVATDNPTITDPAKLREAIEVVAKGGTTLSDGTPLNVSEATGRAYNRAFKSTTTAPLITAGVRANQAEAELPVVDKYINKGRQNYGDTILGYSPKLIKDSFAINDPAAQDRLGEYYAADLLNFDKAALQTRIAGTESGVTIINEVMEKARQSVNSNTMLRTDRARKKALETVSKALREMLSARNKYGIGASTASGITGNQPVKNQNAVNESEVEGREPPAGTIWMLDPKSNRKIPVHQSQIANATMRGLVEVE